MKLRDSPVVHTQSVVHDSRAIERHRAETGRHTCTAGNLPLSQSARALTTREKVLLRPGRTQALYLGAANRVASLKQVPGAAKFKQMV